MHPETLNEVRQAIDSLDAELIALLAKRQAVGGRRRAPDPTLGSRFPFANLQHGRRFVREHAVPTR